MKIPKLDEFRSAMRARLSTPGASEVERIRTALELNEAERSRLEIGLAAVRGESAAAAVAAVETDSPVEFAEAGEKIRHINERRRLLDLTAAGLRERLRLAEHNERVADDLRRKAECQRILDEDVREPYRRLQGAIQAAANAQAEIRAGVHRAATVRPEILRDLPRILSATWLDGLSDRYLLACRFRAAGNQGPSSAHQAAQEPDLVAQFDEAMTRLFGDDDTGRAA